MGTIALVLVVVIITVIVMKWIEKKKEVSVTIMSTDPDQAWELFCKTVVLPKDYVKSTPQVGQTTFSFTLKK